MASLGVAIVREYQRGVVFRVGKVRNVREPGLRFMIPLVDRMQKVSLRTVTKPIQSQQIITKDNVSIGVAAVAYYRRVDPVKSIVEIENVESAIDQIAQTTVRNVVGRSSLDQVLSETESLNEAIKNILDMTSERWGVLVELVELKDIELPESMKRAMAREAEAEREKRAKIIAAEGEALSAGKLAEAADVITDHPIALAAAEPAGARRDRGRAQLDDHLPCPVPRQHARHRTVRRRRGRHRTVTNRVTPAAVRPAEHPAKSWCPVSSVHAARARIVSGALVPKRAGLSMQLSKTFEGLLETFPDASWWRHSTATSWAVNRDELCAQSGYKREDLGGSMIETLVPGRHRAEHVALRAAYKDEGAQQRAMSARSDRVLRQADRRELRVDVGCRRQWMTMTAIVIAAVRRGQSNGKPS